MTPGCRLPPPGSGRVDDRVRHTAACGVHAVMIITVAGTGPSTTSPTMSAAAPLPPACWPTPPSRASRRLAVPVSRTIAGNAPMPAVGLVIDTTVITRRVLLTGPVGSAGPLAATHHQRPLPGPVLVNPPNV